jgi:hypothetical protein
MKRNRLALGAVTAAAAVLIITLSGCSSSNPVSTQRSIVPDNSNPIDGFGNESNVFEAYGPYYSSTSDINRFSRGSGPSDDRITDADLLDEDVLFKSTPEIGVLIRGQNNSAEQIEDQDILDDEL